MPTNPGNRYERPVTVRGTIHYAAPLAVVYLMIALAVIALVAPQPLPAFAVMGAFALGWLRAR